MWVIRLVVLLLVVIALGYVLAANMDQTVDLEFFGHEYLDTPLIYAVAACFVLGFFMALVVMALREWRLRREIRRLKRHARQLDQELADLRTLPLKELSGETGKRGD